MISLVTGNIGEGKTKNLIAKANDAVNTTKGHIVYLDSDNSHIYDLKYKIRYINTSEFPINDYKEFFGFLCGIISEDNDIDEIYIDEILRMINLPIDDEHAIILLNKLKSVSEKFDVNFTISVSCNTDLVPEVWKEYLSA